MPDAILPEPTAEASHDAQVEAVYDAATEEMVTDGGEADNSTATNPADLAPVPDSKQAEKPTVPQRGVITESERQAIRAMGLDDEHVTGWSRGAVERFVENYQRVQTREADLQRQVQALPGQGGQTQQQPTPAGKFSKNLGEVFEKLKTAYDDDITPLGQLLTQMEEANASAREHAALVPEIANLVTDMVLDLQMEAMAKDYPSITAPQSRDEVLKRFWVEWNSGAYSAKGKPIRAQMHEAMKNAAKVVFSNTTEQTAAANLVSQNKKRVASQPKPGPASNGKPRTPTVDDVYDQAYEETIGKELAGRR